MLNVTDEVKKRLEKLSDKNNIIGALAIDQRGSLKKMLSAANGKKANETDIVEFKKVVSSELTQYASAILLDPEYGLPAASVRDSNAGFLAAYEKTGYDATEPGRLPDILDIWSVKKLKDEGADAIKFLLYYDVDEGKEINDKKHAFIERIGSECLAEEMPFFLELVSYDSKIDDVNSIEYAKVKAHKVIGGMKEFSKPQYNVTVLKVEVPVNQKFVEGFNGDNEIVYTKDEAKKIYKEQSDATKLPFIFLSAGVTPELFQEELKFAHESGSIFNGVLCGRATWKLGIDSFAKNGEEAGREWMRTQGKKNIQELNEVLARTATPWTDKVK